MYNSKNYTEQGGDVTHIGGKLVIEQGAEVEGMSGVAYTAGDNITIEGNEISATDTTYEAATESALGLVKQAAAIADATDDAVTTVNALLASLRAAGILAAE
jgi:hypothetical protein